MTGSKLQYAAWKLEAPTCIAVVYSLSVAASELFCWKKQDSFLSHSNYTNFRFHTVPKNLATMRILKPEWRWEYLEWAKASGHTDRTACPVTHQLHCTCNTAEGKTWLIFKNSMKANMDINFICTSPSSSICRVYIVLCFQSRLRFHVSLVRIYPHSQSACWKVFYVARKTSWQKHHAVRYRINSTSNAIFVTKVFSLEQQVQYCLESSIYIVLSKSKCLV